MTDKARIRIAAGVTVLFLAAISVAGLATQSDPPRTTPALAPAAAPAAQAFTVRRDGDFARDQNGEDADE